MSLVAMKVNCCHLKGRVPYSRELASHLYRCVIATVAIVHKTKKPQAQVFLQHKEYQLEFDVAMQTSEPEQVIVNLGLVEPPWQFLDINEQIEDFLSKEVSERRDNMLSVSLDKDYCLVVCLRII